MDFGFLNDLIDFVNQQLGTDISKGWRYAVAGPFIAFAAWVAAKRMWLAYKRWRGKQILDTDGRIVVQHIKTDLERLQNDLHKAVKSHGATDLSPILELLSERIDRTQELIKQDDDGDNGLKLDRFGRVPRRHMVRLVRETLVSNLWRGNYFTESRTKPHVYQALVTHSDGKPLAISVTTPYASTNEIDPPYLVTIRHGQRTVLRISWDPANPDAIDIPRCDRGGWEQIIMSWNSGHEHVPTTTETPKPHQKAA